MLRKLFKHEIIATGRIMGAVYAVVALIMGYELISYFLIQRDEATLGQRLGVAVLLLISMCMFMLTAVVMVTNFQKSLYGDQGYLSFTLPVKSVSLLSSKVIISTFWFLAAFACFIGTAALTLFVLKEDVLGESFETLESVLPLVLGGKSIGTVITFVLIKLISLFIAFAMFTIEVYFAITVANTRLFQKHYILWTIIFSFATIFVSSTISSKIAEQIEFGLVITEDKIGLLTKSTELTMDSLPLDLVSIIISIIFGLIFFYLTHYLMSKKVNIR